MRTHPTPAAALSAAQAAEYLGLHPATLRRLARQGVVPGPVAVSPGRRVWLRAELDAYLAQRRAERDDGPRAA